jgi:hypothetical protein
MGERKAKVAFEKMGERKVAYGNFPFHPTTFPSTPADKKYEKSLKKLL